MRRVGTSRVGSLDWRRPATAPPGPDDAVPEDAVPDDPDVDNSDVDNSVVDTVCLPLVRVAAAAADQVGAGLADCPAPAP
jgi:hypothetical protein